MKRYAITFVGLDNCPRPNRVKFRRDMVSEDRSKAVAAALLLPKGRVESITQVNIRYIGWVDA